MTMIFYDWEFFEDGTTIEPISLGMVSETGFETYLINQDFDWGKATDWLKENVKPNLYVATTQHNLTLTVPKRELVEHIRDFLYIESEERSKGLELVGYYADYDHVLLAQQ